jgi:glucose/arabinose dehydrogenase
VIERFGPCRKRVVPRPVASFGLHPSANGLAFQTTDEWGDDYRNDLFVTEWGSLFGQPSGHKVVRVELDESGTKVTALTDFLEMDTPLDLTFHPDGSMYVADYSGTIFKVTKAI